MRERINERRKCCELHGWCEGSLRRMISLENKYFIDFSLDSSAGTWRALARTVCYTTIREAAPRKAPHFFVSRLPWRAFSLTKVFFQRERVNKSVWESEISLCTKFWCPRSPIQDHLALLQQNPFCGHFRRQAVTHSNSVCVCSST